MLLILSAGLMIGSALTLILRRNRESLLLAAICLSLTIYLVGIMLLISKQGGITRDVERFLYFTHSVRLWFQYRFLTFNQLGLIINVGRHLFPLFLLMMTERYTMVPVIRKRPALAARLSAVLPVLTMLLYIPQVYSELVSIIPGWRAIMFYMSYGWIIAYLLLSTVLLCYELFSITMPFFRRQFLMLVVCLVSLSVLYFIYCGQDPGQVYNFYSYDYLGIRGVGYMLLMPGLAGYIALVVINVAGGLLGIGMLLRYTEDTISNNRDDPGLERKFDVARTGASVFVHGIKNQLLANRVLCRRLSEELAAPAPDLEKAQALARQMADTNDGLLEHVGELYKSLKSNAISMRECPVETLVQGAVRTLQKKYPAARVEIDLPPGLVVLADEAHMQAALGNLLINGWESTAAAGREDPLRVICYEKPTQIGICVQDRGAGIGKYELKKIFEPFYSSKNSNSNWGMGLYYVRMIVKKHMGTLKVDSEYGKGASFYILLPKLLPERGKRGKGHT